MTAIFLRSNRGAIPLAIGTLGWLVTANNFVFAAPKVSDLEIQVNDQPNASVS